MLLQSAIAADAFLDAATTAGDVEDLKGEIERVGNHIRQMKAAHADKVGVVTGIWNTRSFHL